MADSDVKTRYEKEFVERVKAARIATGKKQWQIAELMDIKQDQYKHFETGRVIPHYLIGRFCLICSIDPNWLLTGKGTKPLQPPHAVESSEILIHKAPKAGRSKQRLHRLHRY
jgi:DNA-binding XRE family transcriptional regulator